MTGNKSLYSVPILNIEKMVNIICYNIEMNWELGVDFSGFPWTEGARGPLNTVSD